MCKMDPISLAALRAKTLAARGHTQGTDLDIPDEVRGLLPVDTPRTNAYGEQPLDPVLSDIKGEAREALSRVLAGWSETCASIERDLVEATEERQPSIVDELRTRARIRRSIPRNEPDRIADLCERAADTIDAKQAKIDSLMLEYEPCEMTAEQIITWARNQKPVPFADSIVEAVADRRANPERRTLRNNHMIGGKRRGGDRRAKSAA